ncbi:glycosyl hydrolase family 18 protein [Photobacterium profundum]|uniref:glycoside hydrolase family 18 protein n=1 Tax=Photobacterium profundum TaxID=74109 RepID=UPI003D0F410E
MTKKTLISCLSIAMLFSGQVAASNVNVIGYIPDYRFDAVKKMDITMYTHIHFFSVTPLADGRLGWPSGKSKASMAQYFTDFKNQAASDAKMMITFGGTSEGSSKYFPEMASNTVTRTAFVTNAIQLALDWQADGIDIDWEWGYRPSTTEHKNAYIKLMEELNIEADKHGLLISNAISPSAYFGDNTPVEALIDSDYLVIMSYSYNGAWSKTTGHHSGLERSIQDGFQYWESRGVLPESMHVGVPFYANHYTNATTVGSTFSDFKALTFGQLQDLLAKGYKVVEDDWLGTHAYSDSDNSIVFYDSPSNVAAKINYANEAGYGGIAVWEIGQDDTNQTLSKMIETTNNPDPIDKLSAVIDAPDSAQVNDTVILDGQGSHSVVGSVSYQWTWNGNSVGADLVKLEVAFKQQHIGKNLFSLRVTDREGNTDMVEHTITVSDPISCDGLAAYQSYEAKTGNGYYMIGDQVHYQGNKYEALANNLFNVTPGSADHWWKPLGPCN